MRARSTLLDKWPATKRTAMELFAAATGCSDRKVASLFLARAGNDVTRAVNHFLDSPVVVDVAATAAAASAATTTKVHDESGLPEPSRSRDSDLSRGGDSKSTESSPRRSYKRQRAEPGGGKQQPCLVFERVRPSAGTAQGGDHRHGKTRNGEGIAYDRGSGGQAAAAAGTSRPVPSAEWAEIAERCERSELIHLLWHARSRDAT